MTINPKTPSARARQQKIQMNAQKAAVNAAMRKALKAAKVPKTKPMKSVRQTRPTKGDGAGLLILIYLLQKKWFWCIVLIFVMYGWLFV